MTIQHDIGKRIKSFRKAKGFNQTQLSKAIGCDQAHISRIENGDSEGTPTQLHKIAQVLGVSVGALFGETSQASELNHSLQQLSEDLDKLSPEARATFEAAIHALAQSNVKQKVG